MKKDNRLSLFIQYVIATLIAVIFNFSNVSTPMKLPYIYTDHLSAATGGTLVPFVVGIGFYYLFKKKMIAFIIVFWFLFIAVPMSQNSLKPENRRSEITNIINDHLVLKDNIEKNYKNEIKALGCEKLFNSIIIHDIKFLLDKSDISNKCIKITEKYKTININSSFKFINTYKSLFSKNEDKIKITNSFNNGYEEQKKYWKNTVVFYAISKDYF